MEGVKMDKTVLFNFLEEIFFEKKERVKLKKAIVKVGENELEPEDLWEQLVQARVKIIEALLNKIPFLIETSMKDQYIQDFANQKIPKEALKKLKEKEQEIKEKDEFLAQIGGRIDDIFKKMKGNMEE